MTDVDIFSFPCEMCHIYATCFNAIKSLTGELEDDLIAAPAWRITPMLGRLAAGPA